MKDIIINFILIIFCTYILGKIIKKIKKTEDFYEKTIYILVYAIIMSVTLYYILDVYNIPTKLNVYDRLDKERWINFLNDYLITIIGNFISGVILLLITHWQIKKQIENNNDDKRIQNAPIIKYDIQSEYIESAKELYLFNDLKKKTEQYNLFFKIENIGLNHARNFKLNILDANDKKITVYTIDNNQSILEKNKEIRIKMIINGKKNEKLKKIKIIAHYNDLLKNNYKQEIIIEISAATEFDSKYWRQKLIINNIDIKNEELTN